ncbi:MAG: hemolysin family protein [Oligoflexales bacterium]
MTIDTAWGLASVGLLVAANGFFVAAEFALVTVRRTRIEQLASEGSASAKVVRSALQNLDRYIAGTQVGITLASLALGWIGEPAIAALLTPLLEPWSAAMSETAAHTISVGVAFTLITFLHVILGELVPKSLALQKPVGTSLSVARLLQVSVAIFQPLIWSLNGLGNLILRMVGLRAAAGHESVHSARELELLVRESYRAGVLDDLERHMLQRTFRFSETTVAEVMVPRAEMTALDLTLPLEKILDKAGDAKHSRLPVYEKNIDRIEGVLYIHDLFRMIRTKQTDIRKLLRLPLYVPDTLHLDEMIKRFKSNNIQIAIVVDEHGGTAGLVTLEDIIEAVFGQMQDQNEEITPEYVTSEGGQVTVRGDSRLVDLRDTFGWRFELEGIDTMGGFVMHKLGRIPKVGDEITVNRRKIKVVAMDRRRVAQVVIFPKDKAVAAEAAKGQKTKSPAKKKKT